ESRRPAWGEGEGWRLSPEPEWVIGMEGAGGGESDQIPLSGVQDIHGFPDGRVVFGHRASSEVLVYDSLGRLERRLGGAGDGPGELRRVGDLFPCAGDTILVLQNNSLDLFDVQEGFVLRRLPAPGSRRPRVWAVAGDCRRILTGGEPQIPPLGESGYFRQALTWADTAFAVLDTVAIDSVPGAWVAMDPYASAEGAAPWPRFPPWTGEFSLAVRDTVVIRGYESRPELRWYLPDGRVQRIVRWDQAPAAVTGSDRRLYDEKRRRYAARVGDVAEVRRTFPEWDDWPAMTEVKPFFDAIRVDDTGHLWVLRNPGTMQHWAMPPVEETPPQRWMIFDDRGRWLGEVEMPERFALHVVAGGRVLGVAKDSLDVETVRAYRVLR
ncbi:MAG: hypothetical protein RQ745_13900, partial [Longimicrobiales bacterium]|nr:hypothetical protein [Longimicrobiales bacterium]